MKGDRVRENKRGGRLSDTKEMKGEEMETFRV